MSAPRVQDERRYKVGLGVPLDVTVDLGVAGLCSDADADGACDDDGTCPLTSNPDGGVAVFGQTLVALDETTFGWPVPEDVLWALGDLAGVSGYELGSVGSAAAATAISSGPDPAPGEGTFVLVRADCPLSTWSTGAASECPQGACPNGGEGPAPAVTRWRGAITAPTRRSGRA